MLFDTFSARSLQLANRMVMAPMTRSRATPQHTPVALMATHSSTPAATTTATALKAANNWRWRSQAPRWWPDSLPPSQHDSYLIIDATEPRV